MISYLSHWNLEFSPYRGLGEAYPAPPFAEALARIQYLVTEQRSLGAVVASMGMGKSTVLAAAVERLTRAGSQVTLVDAFGISSRELLWQIACGLDAQPSMGDGVSRLWQRLADLAVEQGWQQRSAVVLVDDAGQAGPDVCQQIVRLTRLASHANAAWTILLASSPSQADRWPESIRDRIELQITLDPWEPDTTIDYLQHALLEAGRLDPVFTEDALRLVHSHSEGSPRLVARLADASLVLGARAGVAIVDTGIVQAAHGQVTWSAAAG